MRARFRHSVFGQRYAPRPGALPRKSSESAPSGERTGLDVPEVTDLPDGVTGDPTYQAAGVVSATFTFPAETKKAVNKAGVEGPELLVAAPPAEPAQLSL